MQLKVGDAWQSLSPGPPPFLFLELFSIFPHSRTPLVSSLPHHAAAGAHFWTPPFSAFSHSCYIHFFLVQLVRSACLTTNLSSALDSSEEEKAFLLSARSSCLIIHACIHLLIHGQHPSRVVSASHIFLCLDVYSSWTTEHFSCSSTSQTSQCSLWTAFLKSHVWRRQPWWRWAKCYVIQLVIPDSKNINELDQPAWLMSNSFHKEFTWGLLWNETN